MSFSIERAAVLGSGVMGSALAAHLANAGIPVLLLDIVPPAGAGVKGEPGTREYRDAFTRTGGLERARKAKPAPFFSAARARRVSTGNLEDDVASYPELNSSEEAPALYEGTEVGFSSLSINMEIKYKFLDDVIRELAAITPGPYIHIGGDEAHSTPKEDYKKFIERFQQIILNHNKIPVGWAEIGEVELDPKTIAQHWQGTAYQGAKEQGNKIILSPGNKTYLDMKYDESSPLGLNWAGYISVKDSYDWEPVSYMEGLDESSILGIEAPLWSETLLTMKDIEFMAFPRLPGLAELAWSSKTRGWDEYKVRLARHGRLMDKLGINYFKSPDVDWE